MSDTILKLIPSNPGFIPDKESLIAARSFLDIAFKGSEIEVIQTENIEFVDQGANFESMNCNLCGQLIDDETWQDAMDMAYETHFENLAFTTPCCAQTSSLNNILYTWPAGFAKFCISILNPAVDAEQHQLAEIERILGISIKKIWAHY
jgi:hypothetical protein